jgi:type VI secretion system secreted protein Hcp
MFLSVKGAVAGVIRGESQDATHTNEIEVLSWSWGMHGQREMGSQLATGRAVVHELRIVKRVDRASTALMSALRHNEEIQKAVLTLRKAGRTALEFLKITIEQGRVNTYEVEGGDRSGSADVLEHVGFTFNKITVEYVPQGRDGQALGGTTYIDEWSRA